MTKTEPKSWISKAPERPQANEVSEQSKRIEAHFKGFAFTPHRHDTYTLALTTSGVQSFNYRGSLRHSIPGEVVILHPDELHDGLSGTDAAFGYRAITIDPVDIQNILQGHSLPFLEGGVTKQADFVTLAGKLLSEFDRPLDVLEYQDLLYDFAVTMQRETQPSQPHTVANYRAMRMARDYINDRLDSHITLDALAQVTGYSKWQITRDFRVLYGTTPYRYLLLRRLEKATQLMSNGMPVAEVAYECCFSDQSHFNRQFKKSYGMTPTMWKTLFSAKKAE